VSGLQVTLLEQTTTAKPKTRTASSEASGLEEKLMMADFESEVTDTLTRIHDIMGLILTELTEIKAEVKAVKVVAQESSTTLDRMVERQQD
jgi:hypothetical protein